MNLTAFITAAICGVAAVLIRFSDIVGDETIKLAFSAAASVTAVLFLSLLFDPAVRYAMTAANRDLQGALPFFFRFLSPFDKEWGIFGTKLGGRTLQVLRFILFVEFIVFLVMPHSNSSAFDAGPLGFAFLGVFIATMLCHAQLKNHYPRPHA